MLLKKTKQNWVYCVMSEGWFSSGGMPRGVHTKYWILVVFHSAFFTV